MRFVCSLQLACALGHVDFAKGLEAVQREGAPKAFEVD